MQQQINALNSEPLRVSPSPAQSDAEAKAQNGAFQSEADVIESVGASSSKPSSVDGRLDSGNDLPKSFELLEDVEAGTKESSESQDKASTFQNTNSTNVPQWGTSIEANGATSSAKSSDLQNPFVEQAPDSDGDVEGIIPSNFVAAEGSVKGKDDAESQSSSPGYDSTSMSRLEVRSETTDAQSNIVADQSKSHDEPSRVGMA